MRFRLLTFRKLAAPITTSTPPHTSHSTFAPVVAIFGVVVVAAVGAVRVVLSLNVFD